CTLKTKAKNLEDSAIESLKVLVIDLIELDRWNCCGAVYSLADDDLVHILAPVRDLIRARDQGFDKVVVLCSMCYNTLARANLLMRNDEVKRDTLNTFMEEENDYHGEVEVVHYLEVLRDEIGWDKLRDAVKTPLTDWKVAPYYGCTLTRPDEVTIDKGLTHTIFSEFIEAIGADPVNWDDAETCCGSYQIISDPDAASKTVSKIVSSAKAKTADILALSCPLCEYNVGRRQADLLGEDSEPLPTFYFTQLLAIALGLDDKVSRMELNSQQAREWLKEKVSAA
ncbi:MAG: heterodisulfide reductase, subunit B, partial [Calditrichaeota bacterium]|nr:heterodisulfide reductase, subunit B [Calditrichota bacterium]